MDEKVVQFHFFEKPIAKFLLQKCLTSKLQNLPKTLKKGEMFKRQKNLCNEININWSSGTKSRHSSFRWEGSKPWCKAASEIVIRQSEVELYRVSQAHPLWKQSALHTYYLLRTGEQCSFARHSGVE